MKTFKFSLVLRTRENTDVFISLEDNIYGIHSKRINILYLLYSVREMVTCCRIFIIFYGLNGICCAFSIIRFSPSIIWSGLSDKCSKSFVLSCGEIVIC